MNVLDIANRVVMDNLRGTESGIQHSENNGHPRASLADNSEIIPRPLRKCGAHKFKKLRSEKISCRLTPEEKLGGELYCKKHGINEAKLLRASYLSAILQPPDERMTEMVNALLPLDGENLSINQKLAIRLKAKHVMKRSAMALLLILLGGATSPTISKGFWFVYEKGKELIYDGHTACIYHTESKSPGCELVEQKPSPPNAAYIEYMKRSKELCERTSAPGKCYMK